MAESFWERARHPGWIAGGVVAIATAVMAVVAVFEYVREPDTSETSGTATEPAVTPVGADPTSQPDPASGTDASTVTELADLRLVSGASWLAPLPEDLAGQPGYEGAIVIACPSNQTDDRISEVTYETRNRYSTLDAELRPYRDPPDDVLVDLWVFSDPPDRLPGGEPPGDPHRTQLRMGEVGAVQGVDIRDSYYLRLRVECDLPRGFMILTGAVVRRT